MYNFLTIMIVRFVQAKKDGTLAKYTFELICCHSTTTTLIPTTTTTKTKTKVGLVGNLPPPNHHYIYTNLKVYDIAKYKQ